MPQDRPGVAGLPFGRLDGFARNVGRVQLGILAFDLHFGRINFVGALLAGINQQVALPKPHQVDTFLLSVIDIPRFGRIVVVADDGERDGLPSLLLRASCGLLAGQKPVTGQEKSGGEENSASEMAMKRSAHGMLARRRSVLLLVYLGYLPFSPSVGHVFWSCYRLSGPGVYMCKLPGHLSKKQNGMER